MDFGVEVFVIFENLFAAEPAPKEFGSRPVYRPTPQGVKGRGGDGGKQAAVNLTSGSVLRVQLQSLIANREDRYRTKAYRIPGLSDPDSFNLTLWNNGS